LLDIIILLCIFKEDKGVGRTYFPNKLRPFAAEKSNPILYWMNNAASISRKKGIM